MPLAMEEQQLDGKRIVRMVCSGTLGAQEMREMLSATMPEGQFFGLHILSIMQPGTKFTPEARAVFKDPSLIPNAKRSTVAAVFPNVLLRVAMSFIFKVTQVGNQRTFATEDEAKEWLKKQP